MEIKARVPGKIMEIKVKVGDAVKTKDVVAVMEAMKMQQAMPTPQDGIVKEIRVNTGERVNPGTVLMVIE